MKYFIWNREVGIAKAAKLCGSVGKFKGLRDKAKRNASPEYTFYIGGKNLSLHDNTPAEPGGKARQKGWP